MSLADQSQLWYPTSVQVTVHQARSLRTKGKNGTNDAYAVMQVAKEKFSTSVAEKCVAPVWTEEATFDLPLFPNASKERSTLHVHVMHRALVGPDKLLGQAVINLLELHENTARSKTEWFKLLDKTGKHDKDRGEVLLDIQFMKNNMTASMFDLSGSDKRRSRIGKLKDKMRGKKREGLSDSASAIVPSFSQVLTDSEGEGEGESGDPSGTKKKKNKLKSLFAPKSGLHRNVSQSMSTLSPLPEVTSSGPSGLTADPHEGKKKFKFLTHKRTGSSDSKMSQGPPVQSNLCINGSHIYTEEPEPRSSRAGSTFSLSSSGRGSLEDLQRTSRKGSSTSVDSCKTTNLLPHWAVEQEEDKAGEEEEEQRKQENKERFRQEQEAGRILEREKQRKIVEEKERISLEEEQAKEDERRRIESEESERIKSEKQRNEDEKTRIEEYKMSLDEQMKEEERRKAEERMLRLEMEQREEEERMKLEEEKVRVEEQRKAEEKRKMEEDMVRLEEERKGEERRRKQIEEEGREKERKIEEERIRLEEQRKEEERRQKQIEEERKEEERRKMEEERIRVEEQRKEEERKRKQIEEERKEEERRKMEEERIRVEEQRKEEERERKQREEERKEEERRKMEEERIRVEEQRKEEERKRKQREEERKEEERRKMEEERIRVEEQRKEEERKRKQREEGERKEEERRKMEEERIRLEEQRRKEEKVRAEREEKERLKLEEQMKEEERRRAEEKMIVLDEELRKKEKRMIDEQEEREGKVRQRAELERLRTEHERVESEEDDSIKEDKSMKTGTAEERPDDTNQPIPKEGEGTHVTSSASDHTASTNPFEEPPSTMGSTASPPGPLNRITKVSAVKPRAHAVKHVGALKKQPDAPAAPDSKSVGIVGGVQLKKKVLEAVGKGPYSQLTQEELISLVERQQNQLSEKDRKIVELEEYIDRLLVRVIEEQPSILMSLNSLK